MDPYQRSQLSDGMREEKFNKGDYVIREGEKGDKFYIVENGELIAT